MLKKQRRRQDEQRTKAKFRKIARRQAGDEFSWVLKREWKDIEGKPTLHYRLDNSGAVERLKWIEKTAAKQAHHFHPPCEMCSPPRHERKKKHKREAEKKAPFIMEDE